MVVSNQYCPELEWLPDGKANCKVYSKHLGRKITHEHKCISAEMSAQARLLPNTCGYVKRIPGYSTRVINFPKKGSL